MIGEVLNWFVAGLLFVLALFAFIDLIWYIYRNKKGIKISEEEQWRRTFDALPILFLVIGVLWIYYGAKYFLMGKVK